MPSNIRYIGRNVERLKGEADGEEPVLPFFSVDQVQSFRTVFTFLNDKDRDILFLIFVSRKKQKDVQRILNRSQPSLCYDIKRIRRRLKFIFYIHSVFDIFVNFLVDQRRISTERKAVGEEGNFTEEELEILTMMFYSSSFTMTADRMGISQVRVRYSYNKCLKRMEELELWEPYEIFIVIRSNLNIIRRIYRGATSGLRVPLIV